MSTQNFIIPINIKFHGNPSNRFRVVCCITDGHRKANTGIAETDSCKTRLKRGGKMKE